MSIALPSLSKIWAWDTQHLAAAAIRWDNAARVWDDAFTTVAGEIGGTPWEGGAAKAAKGQAAMDRVKVVAIADDLRNAAGIASRGAGQLDFARRTALSAVARAQEDGFEVGEDLSVTDPDYYSPIPAVQAAREALAQAHANHIGTKALELAALDQQVAKAITDAATRVDKISFDPGLEDAMPLNLLGGLPAPAGPHIIYCYPSASPNIWLCEGYEIGKGPYAFDSPIDVSGVG